MKYRWFIMGRVLLFLTEYKRNEDKFVIYNSLIILLIKKGLNRLVFM